MLLIEDSADAREMLRMILELAGHVVYDTADGVRGLELVNLVRPDVGIIDIGPDAPDQRRCRSIVGWSVAGMEE